MNPGKRKGLTVRLPVRTKILLAFLALSVTALLLTGFFAFVEMEDTSHYAVNSSMDLGSRASADSTAALERDAQASLLRLAKDQAYISNIIIERVGDDLNIMSYYAGEILHHDVIVREQHIPTQYEQPDNPFSTSVLYLSPGADESALADEIKAAGMMTQIFIPVYATDPQTAAVYVGTDSGISVVYPWTDGLNASFDPRQRSWFIDAKKSGNITWSNPHVDLLGHGLRIPCSRPVYDKKSRRVWVVGADVTIETINQNIIGTQVGENGYAMLIDENGNVITRPGLTAGDQR